MHDMVADVKPRSIIRWAGSKRQLIPSLRPWIPHTYNNYVEPFAGSACVFFDLAPTKAILGDINSELMLTYRQLRRSPTALHEAVSKIPRTPQQYYTIRSLDPASLTAFDRAKRFIYLNRNCFNAVYRVNKKGHFNVPWGTRTGDTPSAEEFRACARLLRRADLVTSDFESMIDRAMDGDFLYLDPPYTKSVADEPGLFGAGAFKRQDMERLLAALRRAADRGAKYLLSFEYDKSLVSALPGATVKRIVARRHVAGFSGSRGLVRELIFTNTTSKK